MRAAGHSRILKWDEIEALEQHYGYNAPKGGWESIVVDDAITNPGYYITEGHLVHMGDAYTSLFDPTISPFPKFVHEAWHVWQNDWLGPWGTLVGNLRDRLAGDYYNPSLNGGSFGGYGIEQQATLMEWGYHVRIGSMPWVVKSNFPQTPVDQARLLNLLP